MEQNQQPLNLESSSIFQLNLDAQNSYNLRSSASWAKVLGVVGMLTGIIIIIFFVIGMSKVNSYDYGYRRGGFDDMTSFTATKTGLWIFLLTAIIFILGGFFSFNYGNKINAALRSNDQQGLNAGFAALRNYFAVRGITIILVLILFLLSLFAVM
jgi:hypothetical protein